VNLETARFFLLAKLLLDKVYIAKLLLKIQRSLHTTQLVYRLAGHLKSIIFSQFSAELNEHHAEKVRDQFDSQVTRIIVHSFS
jgi:preprotein translocase subunit SecY